MLSWRYTLSHPGNRRLDAGVCQGLSEPVMRKIGVTLLRVLAYGGLADGSDLRIDEHP